MIIRAMLKALALPPLAQLLGILLALCWWNSALAWRRRLARLLMLSLGSLWLLSTPLVSHSLLSSLEQSFSAIGQAELSTLNDRVDAIVILGGGRREAAPEFSGQDVVAPRPLERLRYGAYLHRQTGLPILVSGGRVFNEPFSEAELMARELREHFGVSVQWQEDASRTTAENARLSFELLQQEGAGKTGRLRVALVTQSWHMPRAVMSYRQAGFEVVAAPTAFSFQSDRPTQWLPSASALATSSTALHEYLGLLVYRLEGG